MAPTTRTYQMSQEKYLNFDSRAWPFNSKFVETSIITMRSLPQFPPQPHSYPTSSSHTSQPPYFTSTSKSDLPPIVQTLRERVKLHFFENAITAKMQLMNSRPDCDAIQPPLLACQGVGNQAALVSGDLTLELAASLATECKLTNNTPRISSSATSATSSDCLRPKIHNTTSISSGEINKKFNGRSWSDDSLATNDLSQYCPPNRHHSQVLDDLPKKNCVMNIVIDSGTRKGFHFPLIAKPTLGRVGKYTVEDVYQFRKHPEKHPSAHIQTMTLVKWPRSQKHQFRSETRTSAVSGNGYMASCSSGFNSRQSVETPPFKVNSSQLVRLARQHRDATSDFSENSNLQEVPVVKVCVSTGVGPSSISKTTTQSESVTDGRSLISGLVDSQSIKQSSPGKQGPVLSPVIEVQIVPQKIIEKTRKNLSALARGTKKETKTMHHQHFKPYAKVHLSPTIVSLRCLPAVTHATARYKNSTIGPKRKVLIPMAFTKTRQTKKLSAAPRQCLSLVRPICSPASGLFHHSFSVPHPTIHSGF